MLAKRTVNTLTLISLAYLFLPFAIFLFGWIKLIIALPLVIAGAWFLWQSSVSEPKAHIVHGSCFVEICILVILATWVLIAGVGGFMWQNSWDHSFRNAVFADLVTREWPVTNGASTLVYYLGFWLPAALCAKFSDSLTVGYIGQYLYALLGILLAFRLTVQLIGRVTLGALAVFILFSGLDIIASFIVSGNLPPFGSHFDKWNPLALWDSNTTLLFWVYNQAIPAWVGTMLMISNLRKSTVALLILCFMSISAPFACVGLFPLCIYSLFNNVLSRQGEGVFSKISKMLTPANIYSVIAVIPVAAYFAINTQSGAFHLAGTLYGHSPWIFAAMNIALEIAIFLPFIFQQVKRDKTFYILLFTSTILIFIQMGDSFDFSSRTELPLNYFITYQVMRYVSNWRTHRPVYRVAFIIVLTATMMAPLSEMWRTAAMCESLPRAYWRVHAYDTIFDTTVCRDNFVADNTLPRDTPLGFIFRTPVSRTISNK
ncbi:MAG: hypothetical protein NC187_06660 [Candidatus Amulumruptor caecigallinarius]|nr:hypothetical protein [Candidatus Amulumruptor caecigallinarius]MCM1397150.1 hypothetical protein [Candidatus Amulumruptor caecigallinarius]MCM1453161.1 hypothetical protein [bacterium]